MAKFNLDSIKNSIGKMSLFGKKDEDFETDEEQFEEEEIYDDGYLGGEEDADRDDEEYEDEYEDAGEYEDGEEYEDEEAYEDAADEEYDDSDYADEEGEADEEEYYDDAEEDYLDGEEEAYDDDEYVDEEVYGDAEEEYEEEQSENLGYDPSLFENLDDDEEYYEEEDGYEEAEDDGEYYEEEDEELDDEEPASLMDKIRGWLENPYVVYGLVILLPIIALIWLWFPKKYEDKKRYILSAIALVCLILWLIILIPGGGSNDPVLPDDPFTRVPVASATPTAVPTEPAETPVPGDNTPDPAASPTAHVVTGGDGTIDSNSFVYVTNSGIYYHLISDCGGIQNTSKITLDAATGRGLTACPDCAGGVNNNVIDTPSALYATSGGKWYHSNPTCQGMTGASVVTEANAIAAKKTACPVCIGYYGTPGGTYYHNISNCSGMLGAITKTKDEWAKDGKQPCPTCIGGNANANGGKIPTETQVYYTTNGTYYHTKSNCSGMKNATVGSISSAVKLGKKLCTSCVTKANTYVFATQNGTYYHTKSNCSGMKNASYITAKAAISKNKKPCPTCAKMFGTATSDTGNGTTVKTNTSGTVGTVNSTNYTFVYYTNNGKYFHVKKNCSGMTNAKNASYASAVAAGKSACPTCIKSSAVTVFATTAGKYYHTDSSCSKMTNAQTVSAQVAINYGKAACPNCAYALSKGFKATKTDTATNNNNGNNNTNVNGGSASAESVVYIKTGKGANNYYHTAAKCSGQSFSGGLSVTLEYALSHNYKSCPSCKPASKILT